MFKIIKKISAVFLALVVIIATSGFNIYTHNCGCCETTDIWLAKPETCCKPDIDNTICEVGQFESSSDCCHTKTSKSDNHQTCSSGSCCLVEQTFYKIYSCFQKQKNNNIEQVYPQHHNVLIIKTDIEATNFIKKMIFISGKSPPKISVADFLIFCHTLKIPS